MLSKILWIFFLIVPQFTSSFAADSAPSCSLDQPPADSCLIGTWTLDPSSVADFYRRQLNRPGMEFKGVTGLFEVEFTAQGETIWSTENWRVEIQSQGRGREAMSMVQTSNGKVISQYSTKASGSGENMACASVKESTLRVDSTITVGGRTVNSPRNPTMDNFLRSFTYQCGGDQLVYLKGLGIGPRGTDMDFNYRFHRSH